MLVLRLQGPTAKRIFVAKSCQKHGLCVCGAVGLGQVSLQLHLRLVAILKRLCWSKKKQKSACRLLLEDALLVLCLRPAGVPQDQASQQELWYHPGYVNYKTWALTFHRLVREQAPETCSDGAESICVKSVCLDMDMDEEDDMSRACFATSLQAFLQDVDFEAAYVLDMFRMDTSLDALGRTRMTLGRVRLLALPGSDADGPTRGLEVWKGRLAEEADRSAAAAAARRAASGARAPRGAGRGRRGQPPASRARPARPARQVDEACVDDAPWDMDISDAESNPVSSAGDGSSIDIDLDSNVSNVAAEDDAGASPEAWGGSELEAGSDISNESEILAEMLEQLEEEHRERSRAAVDQDAAAGAASLSNKGTSSSSSSSSSSNSNTSNRDSSSSSVSSDDDQGPDNASDMDDMDGPAEALRMMRAAAIREEVFVLPDDLGELDYSVSGEYIRAHCWRHGDACRRQRTIRSSDAIGREGQGRPVGLLIAWLQRGHEKATAAEHVAMRSNSFTRQERQAARQYLYSLPGGHAWADEREREQRGREAVEPEWVP